MPHQPSTQEFGHLFGSLKAIGRLFSHHAVDDRHEISGHVGTLLVDGRRLLRNVAHESLRQRPFRTPRIHYLEDNRNEGTGPHGFTRKSEVFGLP